MVAEDPVLQRDLFRSREKDVEQAGIASVANKGDEGYNSRVEEAKRLFEQARIKQDPSRFQTLSEQEKPGVFRPVPAGATQMPQPNIQQQIAQMQAMGFRPVGMANGGYVARMREGGMTPTVAPVGGDAATSKTSISEQDPASWTDEDIMSIAQERLASDPAFRKSHEEYAAKTPFGRGIQSINPFSNDPLDSLIADLKVQRAYSKSDKGRGEYNKSLEESRKATEEKLSGVTPELRKAWEETPVTSVFSEVTAEKRAAELERRKKAEQKAEDLGISSIPEAQIAGNSGDYMGKVPSDTSTPAAQVAGGSGDYMSKIPSGIAALDEAESRREFLRGKALSEMAAPVSPKEEANKSNVFDTYSTNLEKIKADRAAQRQENINLALMQAGLAIAGGTSPNALTNIGQGGIAGLQAFGQAEKESRMDMRQAQQDLRAEQERARDEAYRREALGVQKEAQRFKQEVEFPETIEMRKAGAAAATESKRETAITNTANLFERRMADIRREISDLNKDPMMPAADKKAAIEALVSERDDLMRRYNDLLKKSGLGVPEAAQPTTSDTSGFTLRGVR